MLPISEVHSGPKNRNISHHNEALDLGPAPRSNLYLVICFFAAFLLLQIEASAKEDGIPVTFFDYFKENPKSLEKLDEWLSEEKDWEFLMWYYKRYVDPKIPFAKNCVQFLEQLKRGKITNFDGEYNWMAVAEIFHRKNAGAGFNCLFYDILKEANSPKKSFFQHMRLGDTLFSYLPVEKITYTENYAHAGSPHYKDLDLSTKDTSDFVFHITIGRTGFDIIEYRSYVMKENTQKQQDDFDSLYFYDNEHIKIDCIAASDFDGDGVEDIIIRSIHHSKTGTRLYITYHLVRKLSHDGPLLVTPLPMVKYGPDPLIKP